MGRSGDAGMFTSLFGAGTSTSGSGGTFRHSRANSHPSQLPRRVHDPNDMFASVFGYTSPNRNRSNGIARSPHPRNARRSDDAGHPDIPGAWQDQLD